MSTAPVDWAVAERVGIRTAQRGADAAVLPRGLVDDLAAATDDAVGLVAARTGLDAGGPAVAEVVDRAAWVQGNVTSFRHLLTPLTDRLAEHLDRPDRPANRRVAAVGRRVAGAELGLLLGWMSTRVLGQYDLLVVDDDDPTAGGTVRYVGPNIVALERRFGFDPRQFRLWIALHECTHRAQFVGVPWLREHYLGLVHALLAEVDPDPGRFRAALGDAARAVRDGQGGARLAEGGVAALVASPRQRDLLARIGGLMALVEGHGDVTMNRAGGGRIPDADRFARVLSARRTQQPPLARVLQRLIGLEAKLAQYRLGEAFIAEVERVLGPGAVDTVWAAPDRLPTMDEIREPERWMRRLELR